MLGSRALITGALLVALAATYQSEGRAASEDRLRKIPGQRDRANDPALASALRSLDPATEGWDSEVFAEGAGRQLASLARIIETAQPPGASTLSGLVTGDVSVGALRPGGLIEIFHDPALTVWRPASGAASVAPGTAPFKTPDGFSRAVQELLRPMKGASRIQVEFQVTGVEASPASAAADVWFHASGHTATGTIEQTASWRTRWDRPTPSAPPLLKSIEVQQFEEVAGLARTGTFFSDATRAVLGGNKSFTDDLMFGVDHWLERLESWVETDAFGHNGIALGDVNGDGLDDLYICQMAGLPNLLFVQNPDGTATDVSAQAGVDWLERTRSAMFLDLDNDGDEDLVVATSVALLFMENDGKGHFRVRASLSASEGMVTAGPPVSSTRTGGVPEEGMSGGHYQRSGDFGAVKTSDIVSLAAADYDNDGLLDIYACAYHNSGDEANRFPLPMPYHDANNGGANLMIRNEGNWRFSNVTSSSGLDVNNHRFSFAASWEDFDNDGDQDLYVANDFGRANLYRNDHGHFVDIAEAAGVVNMAAGMSVSWADYDNDGWMDIYVANMFSAAGSRIATQKNFKPDSDAATLAAFRHHAMGNSLYHNTHDGKFADVSLDAAVNMGRWSWSSNFIDFNNDGWEDLLVANGYFTKEDPQDLSGFFWRDVVRQSPDKAVDPAMAPAYAKAWGDLGRMIHRGRSFSGRERNCAFLNTHGSRFANVSAATGLDFIDDARAVAITDWDLDGDLDVWIVNRTGPRLRFARNDTSAGGHHLSLLLEGRKSNRDAIGARLELELPGSAGRRIIKTVHAGDGYLAQSSRWIHFGLGEATSIGRLLVRWPGGSSEEFTGIAADGRYRIVEGAGKAQPWTGPARHVKLQAAELAAPAPSEAARILLSAPALAPSLEYESLDGQTVSAERAGPLLVYLWSTADARSVEQLGELARRASEFKTNGLRLVALSIDGVGHDEPPDPGPVRGILESIKFPYEAGFAYPELIDKLDLLQNKVIWSPRPFVVPSSLLVDGDGLVAAIYKGPLSIDRLFADLPALRTTGEKRLSLAIPFAGLRQTRGMPDFFDYMDALAQTYADGGYPEEAVAYYRKLIRIQPGRASAHFGLGLGLAAMGQTDEAIAEYRETVRVDPNDIAALNDLGLALAGQGKDDEAIGVYQQALGIDGAHVLTLCNLATSLAGQGKLDEAVALYRKALAAEPANTLALNNLAVALARQGKDDEAIASYARVLQIDPENVPARINMANALMRQGKAAEAAGMMAEAVRLKPDQPETRYNLGLALLKQGRAKEAIEELTEASRLKPGYTLADYYLSLALARGGQVEQAIRQFAVLMKLDPGSPEAAGRLAWVLATSQDASMRDGELALKIAQSARAAGADKHPGLLDAQAAAFAEVGRYREAVQTAKLAVEALAAGGDVAGADQIRARLKLYEAGKPYRE